MNTDAHWLDFLRDFFGIKRRRRTSRYRLKCRSCKATFEIDPQPQFCPGCGKEIVKVHLVK